MHKFYSCFTLFSSYETLSRILFCLPDGVTQCLDHYLLLCVSDYLSDFLAEKTSVSYFVLCISQILYLYFYKRLFCPSNSKSSYKILLLALILSIPVTCFVTHKDLHYHFQGPALSLTRTCIITSVVEYFHLREPALPLPGPCIVTYDELHYHFQVQYWHLRRLALSLPLSCIVFLNEEYLKN